MAKRRKKRKQYLASIASCADDLSKLIDELSLYNKLSTSRIICHPVPTNFSRAIHSFINEDLEYLKSRNVNVSYNTDDSIIAMLDEKEFQRVVFNLLANTIKYRDKDTSEVLIQIYRKENMQNSRIRMTAPEFLRKRPPTYSKPFTGRMRQEAKQATATALVLRL